MSNSKSPRRNERTLAFKVLYSLCFSPVNDSEQLGMTFLQCPDRPDQGDADPFASFAWNIVKGVWSNQQDIDESISSLSQNWRIERMAKVELTILRIATYELLYCSDIPTKVAINEAIEMAKQFGDEKSRSFVNGILDAAGKAIESGKLELKK